MKIDTTKLDNFFSIFKQTQDKVNNIRDAIPVIKQELPKQLNGVNVVETSSNQLPYISKQTKQLNKLFETTTVIPVAITRRTPTPSTTNTVKLNKPRKERINKIGYNSANITTKWLFNNDNNS